MVIIMYNVLLLVMLLVIYSESIWLYNAPVRKVNTQ